MTPRLSCAPCLLLLVSFLAQAASSEVESRLSLLEPVTVSEYHGAQGYGLKLTFGSLGADRNARLFTREDTRALMEALEGARREEFEAIYGASVLALPASLESARWFQALKLSPRYMDEGVREAALELFSSRAVLFSVGMSLVLFVRRCP
jgi:hypothetical protein